SDKSDSRICSELTSGFGNVNSEEFVMKTKTVRERLYLGVDIGGTKIQASLVSESGAILGKQRQSTPRTGGPEQVLSMVETVIQEVLTEAKLETTDLT